MPVVKARCGNIRVVEFEHGGYSIEEKTNLGKGDTGWTVHKTVPTLEEALLELLDRNILSGEGSFGVDRIIYEIRKAKEEILKCLR